MFPFLKRWRVRRWFALLALTLGVAGSGLGKLLDQSNSWWWFGGGVLVAVGIALVANSGNRWRTARHSRDSRLNPSNTDHIS